MNAKPIKDLYDSIKNKSSLTAADRRAVADAVTPYGVHIRSSRCRHSYTDALLEAYRLARQIEGESLTPNISDDDRFVYLQRSPVTVNGRTYSALTPSAVVKALRRQSPELYRVLYKPLSEVTAAPAEEVTPADAAPAETAADEAHSDIADYAEGEE